MESIKNHLANLLFIAMLLMAISCQKDKCEPVGDAIILTEPVAITNSSAVISCDILLVPCDAEIVERGVCYDTSPNPGFTDEVEQKGSGHGSYTVTLMSLNPKTIYHVVSYIIVKDGTIYFGSETSFSTQ